MEYLSRIFIILDFVNLAFHEAGHIIFGIFGMEFLTALGGTLMQLIMPFSAFLYFIRQEKKLSSMVTLFWFGENFLPIGNYMKDALKLELPLIGGGLHDWTYLFGRLGVLTKSVMIGNITIFIGIVIMLYSLVGFCMIGYKRWILKKD